MSSQGGPSPAALLQGLEEARGSAERALEEAMAAGDPIAEVDSVRVRFLGKKGEVSRLLKQMGKLPPDERPKVGQAANTVRDAIETAVRQALDNARDEALRRELAGPPIDVTLPGRPLDVGPRHPVSRTWDEVVDVFRKMGFEAASGPEIEGDFYNFEALNIPPEHPARDMQDTFYLNSGRPAPAMTTEGGEGPDPGDVLLRTHTSPVQVRAMLRQAPPVRIICPGKVYRRDSDPTHTPMFHQIEGLWVDRNVTMADLKGTLQLFAKAFFGTKAQVRFRPSYFQFTEPSAEVDVSCSICGGSGTAAGASARSTVEPESCKTCSGTGWLEILGAGMVDPAVFEAVNYDPEIWSGFAFGMGIDRVAMLKYQIDDLRMLFENDARFLEQFP